MPDWKDEISKRLSSLRLAPTREAEIIEELAQHLDDRYQQSLQGGATEAEAYQAALLLVFRNLIPRDKSMAICRMVMSWISFSVQPPCPLCLCGD